MTSTHGGSHPSPEEVDALLDPVPPGEGVYDVDFEERVAAHVADCQECTRLLEGMRGVRALLRAEGARTPPMPDGLSGRLDAALARASSARAGTVVPMDAARTARRGGRGGASTAPSRVPRWLTVAAGLAVIGGAALASTQLLDRPESHSTSAGALADDGASGEEVEPAPVGDVVSTGTDYGPDTLAAQVTSLIDGPRDVLGGVTARAAPQAGEGADADGGRSDALRLADPTALGRCLAELGAAGQTPLVTDVSTWEGRDAAVIVLPAGGDAVQVWVVGGTCGPDGDALLHYQVVQP